MATILFELDDISDVHRLGLHLGLRMSALDKIRIDCHKLKDQKLTVIYYWLTRRDIVRRKQNEHPTWGRLADAVASLYPALGERIRIHHMYRDRPTPKMSEC